MLKPLTRAALLGSLSAAAVLLAATPPAQAVYWDMDIELGGFFTQPDGALNSGNGDVGVDSALDLDDDVVGQVGLRWTPGWDWLPGLGVRLTELYAESETITDESFILLGVEAQGGQSSIASVFDGAQSDFFVFYPWSVNGFNVQAGLGARMFNADFQLAESGAQAARQFAQAELNKTIAVAHVWAQRDLNTQWRIGAALSGTPEQANRALDAELWSQYELYPGFFGRIGYRHVGFDIEDEPGLEYNLEFGGAFLSLVARIGNGVVPLPPDTDGDGVRDPDDRCMDTPAGAVVDRFGCRSDLDQDGVYDGDDACPDTPRGALVDSTGCLLDGDADGVPDGLDLCPDTAPGLAVDSTGCALDTDGDGVPDSLDLCPDTTAGTVVGEDGCSIDLDSDGVINDLDECPNTPAGAVVDARGCNTDRDGDGVPFALDACLNTPPGTPVDDIGCPLVVDEDGDGVVDDADGCPGTLPGFEVDEFGCVIIDEQQQEVSLPGVTFELDSARLTNNARTILMTVVASMKNQTNLIVEVQGHTDSQGGEVYNQRLSEQRAVAVVRFLVDQGIAPNRLRPVGFGEQLPVADNSTAAGRAQNRRVVLKVLNQS